MHDALSPHAVTSLKQVDDTTQPALPSPVAHPPESPARPRLKSTDLLGNANEVEIRHGEALYRLRLTAQGKLILTK